MKKESYIVFAEKQIEEKPDDYPNLTALAQLFEQCNECKNCPNFAIGNLLNFTSTEHELENYPRPKKKEDILYCEGKKLQIANSEGKRVEIIGLKHRPMWTYVPHDLLDQAQRHTVVGSKRTVTLLGKRYENFLSQIFQYVHMKLGGFCSRGTTFDEPKISGLNNLTMRVDALPL